MNKPDPWGEKPAGDKVPVDKYQPACQLCGGPRPFDTTLPSSLWNSVIRAGELPDYLCLTCIVRTFSKTGKGFTAKLWSDEFDGLPIAVTVSPPRPAGGKTCNNCGHWKHISSFVNGIGGMCEKLGGHYHSVCQHHLFINKAAQPSDKVLVNREDLEVVEPMVRNDAQLLIDDSYKSHTKAGKILLDVANRLKASLEGKDAQ